jgi:PAS domain S-box-containing protein
MERDPSGRVSRDLSALSYLLLDQLPIGVFHKDIEGRYVFVNSCFCRLKESTFIGKTADEVAANKWTPENAEQSEKLRQIEPIGERASHHGLIMHTGQSIEMEERYVVAEGELRYFHVTKGPLVGPDGTISGSQGILLDISERKRAEAQSAGERKMLRALMDSTKDVIYAIYFKDRQSRFRRCSAGVAQLFKLASADDAIGKSDFDFQGKEHAQQAFEDEQEIIRTGQPIIGKGRMDVLPGR